MMVRAVLCDRAEACALLAPLRSHKVDAEHRYELTDLIDQGQPYKVIDQSGEAIAAYVLTRCGPVLWIMAAAGRARFDLVTVIDALATAQGREFDQVGFRTERPGLVRKARRLGYQVTRREGRAYYLRKNIAP